MWSMLHDSGDSRARWVNERMYVREYDTPQYDVVFRGAVKSHDGNGKARGNR